MATESKEEHADHLNKHDDAARKPPQQIAVGYLQLFRAADSWDKVLLFFGTLAALGNGTCLPLFTIIFGEFTDLFGTANMDTFDAGVRDLALKFLYIAIASAAASYVEMAAWMWSGARQTNRLRQQYLAALLHQEIGFFDTEATTGAALQGLNEDCQLIQAAISEKMANFLKMVATFIAGITIAFVRGWDMTLVMLALMPFMVAVASSIAWITTHATALINESYGKANSVAQQSLAQIRTVAAFGQEAKALQEYGAQLEVPERVGIKLAAWNGAAMGGTQMIMFSAYAVAFVYGAWRVSLGLYTGGQVLNVLFAVIMGGFQLGMVGPNLQHFNKGRAAAVNIFRMLERKPAIDATAGGQTLGSVQGALSLRGVCFSYPARPNVQVLSDFDLDIAAGKTVALVGGSGSGKSTVAALVERFYDPQAGSVALDGVDIRRLDLAWLRSNMALVSQEPTLFAISIYANIALGKEGAGREEVAAAAKAANAHSFISSLPGGYDTHVGERGLQLSGGQKQRIAIARAILKNPKILLLDEATSALDTHSERLVQAALNHLTANRTTLVIAHRLSTIRHADSIAVMSKGTIVEQGTHDQLIANSSGTYTALVKLQMQQQDAEAADRATEEEGTHEAEALQEAGLLPGQPVESVKEHVALQVEAPEARSSMARLLGKAKRSGDNKAKKGDEPGTVAGGKAAEGGEGQAAEEPQVKVPMSRLMALNRPEWHYGVVGFIAAAASGCAQPAVAFLMSGFITVFYLPDMVELRRQASFYGLMFFVVACGLLLSYGAMHSSLGVMAQRMSRRLRLQVFSAMLRQEIGWFDRQENSSGVLSSRLASDTLHLRGAVGDVIGLIALNLFNLLFGFLIAYAYNWRMALLVTALIPVVSTAGYFHIKFAVQSQGSVDEMYASSNQSVTESLASIRVIQAYNLQAHVLATYSRTLAAIGAKVLVSSNTAGFANGYANFVMLGIYSLIIWFGAQEIKYGRSSFDSMLKALLGILFAAMGLSQTAMQFPEIGNAKVAVQRIFPLLDRQSAIDPGSGEGLAPAPGSLKGDIELREVTFAYPSRPSVTIFNSLSLSIGAGKTVALVGQSGSGKSTVVGLIERFYDPTGGAVLLDGRDLREYNLRWLRSQMGLVSQEPLLFSASIIDNIRYGKPDATMEEVEAAARAANASAFISSLPEGYDTHVGEQGVQLSGGQKQRIAIARAIVRKPRILLLDEATSALDAASEREVQAALDVIMVGPTSVVIAHRLTTVRGADLICVVQGGAVVEQGSHEQLMGSAGSSYARLVHAQQASKVVY